jgi:hypothetical protein
LKWEPDRTTDHAELDRNRGEFLPNRQRPNLSFRMGGRGVILENGVSKLRWEKEHYKSSANQREREALTNRVAKLKTIPRQLSELIERAELRALKADTKTWAVVLSMKRQALVRGNLSAKQCKVLERIANGAAYRVAGLRPARPDAAVAGRSGGVA